MGEIEKKICADVHWLFGEREDGRQSQLSSIRAIRTVSLPTLQQ